MSAPVETHVKLAASTSDTEQVGEAAMTSMPDEYVGDAASKTLQTATDSGERLRMFIEKADEERRQMVWQRRNPTNPLLKVFQKIVPYGGILSSAFNLASSTIGAGIIALPGAFRTSGMAMATIYLIIVASLTVYSFALLTIVGQRTGLRNWEKISRALLGRGADYFLSFVMWFLCFGGDVSYVISISTVLRAFITHSSTASGYITTNSGIRLITSVVWLVVVLPLCLPKEINSLRIVSAIAILLITFFVICIMVHSGESLRANGIRDDLVYFQPGNQAVEGLSLFMFAFIAQVNCYEVTREMHKPSVKRMTLAATLGMLMCFMLYFCAGFFGYMDFGSTVGGSILEMYDPIANPLMGVSYAGILLKLCVGFALHLIPCRDVLYHLLGTDVSKVAWWKNALLCTLQATGALVAGLFIPRITTVFGLLGGFCGGFVGFVFPALFMMYSGGFSPSQVGWGHVLGTYLLLLTGVVAIVFGTGAAIYAEVKANS